MSFQWADFLRVAEELARQDSEAARRSAVSRAYYAAYNIARKKLPPDLTPKFGDRGIHVQLWTAYTQRKAMQLRTIGMNGERLRVSRTRADYDAHINCAPSPKDVAAAIKNATHIVKQLAEYGGSFD